MNPKHSKRSLPYRDGCAFNSWYSQTDIAHPNFLSEQFVWSIGNYRANSDDVNTRHCYDNSGTNASAIHPSEVTDWNCGGNPTAFSLTCGCATPAPVVNSPAPTPGLYLDPDGSRGIEVPEENMAEDESGKGLFFSMFCEIQCSLWIHPSSRQTCKEQTHLHTHSCLCCPLTLIFCRCCVQG